AHSSPEFEGKLTYDYKGGAWSAHIWTGFMVQSFQNIQVTSLQPVYGFGQTTPIYYNQVTSRGGDKTGVAGEVGATVNFGP
ncbi:hypothetical protein, partial [Enterococcus faecium]|uniref:hypothetical protein n=1 Tax=Enterococcus faecium TaxID=1352 RepID=UPI003F422989